MKNFLFFTGLFLLLTTGLYAQNQMGIATSNFAGTSSVYMNPAFISDSRYFGFLNLFSTNAAISNNYVYFQAPFTLWQAARGKVDPAYLNGEGKPDFKNEYLKERLNGKQKDINISSEARGPAILISTRSTHSFAFTTRSRLAIQSFGVSEPLARLMRNGLDTLEADLHNKVFSDNKFSLMMNAYAEAGLTYSAILKEDDHHSLKGGFTLKRLIGGGSLYFINRGLSLEVIQRDSMIFVQSDISYGYTSEDFYKDFSVSNLFNANRLGAGWGWDLGFTYEYRNNISKFKYRMNGRDRYDNTKNKYKVKIGAALMDFGSIKYKNERYVRAYEIENDFSVTINDTAKWKKWGQLDTLDFNSSKSFDTAVSAIFGYKSIETSFTSHMPATLNLSLDYKFTKNLYGSFTWIQSLRRKNTIGMRQTSSINIVPRYERPQFEAALPILFTYDYTVLQLGAMVRFGVAIKKIPFFQFYIGSDNIGGVFGFTTVSGFDLYTGLGIPLYKRNQRDSDNDGVSNRKDKCKKVSGEFEFSGCPDTDKDGVPDTEDKCPSASGDKGLGGCPDRDGDGVIDEVDVCPDVPGLAGFKGCPDTDADGIQDTEDECPTEAGPQRFRGCPDTDGDSLPDKTDKCPTEPGSWEFAGCPDRDKDGVPDKDDRCPDVPGLISKNGCPDTDKDKDGISDSLDKCPTVPGIALYEGCPDTDGDSIPDAEDKCPLQYGIRSEQGCPAPLVEVKLDLDEEEILKKAFSNLEFETGKAVIIETSFESLDKMVELLIHKKEYKFHLAGHTDDVGKREANQQLSQERAEAVKNYLVSKGIEADRIITVAFGATKPIATNKTEEGRKKNRRVEMKIVK
jgi:outer membrane protein OmpA-like peptidoglycan-associated protein